jgi:hypothetical protein
MSSQSQYLKKLHQSALQDVVDDLVKEKEEGWKSRTSQDSYTTKLKCFELTGISITCGALYQRDKRQSKKKPNAPTGPVEELIVNQNDSKVSSISSPSTGSNTTDSYTESQDLPQAMISSTKAGRPKGSTMQKKRDDINNYKECVNAIAEEYHNELTFHKEKSKRLMKGYLEAVIEQKKDEFGVSDDIPVAMIRTRIKRGSLAPTHPGTSPPLLNAELALVEICIQMGKI